jgi:predicted dehydrogenase
VGHSERFNPVVRALARLLRRDPPHARKERRSPADPVLAIDLHRAGMSRATDCGVLVNLAVHDFDLAAYLAGGCPSLRAAVGGDDFAHVLFDTAAGSVGHLYVDGDAPEKRRTIALVTSRWKYEGDLLAPRLVRSARVGEPPAAATDVPLPLDEPLRVQALALADALDGAASREIATGADGALAVKLAEQAATLCASAAENLSLFARP